ncbi:sensor histidine kinase [Sporolactobacillus terrae]|uniref:histidine kinase n=1 Tax=Sporolactobacillus terrae TaxID=269673 RepID=A0A410D7E7_9BACL|nr:sensor histidine kinase [Sporolactobacillus terrae]QAA22023.1 sensor histidine kinase [Sporolactobacillus terrae]QAA24996.1 sensor histidine kinase [Sporolactobacillus terrae]BBN98312.1 membrane protein [Sporolactobacillus terrae]
MTAFVTMLFQLFERAALLIVFLFLVTRMPRFKEILQREKHSASELAILTSIFCLFAILSTYSGIHVDGSLVNVRVATIVSSGILFGPVVGIITGVVAGLHRYLIDIGGVTALPCFITSTFAGLVSVWIHRSVKKSQRWIYGIAGGMFCELLTMLLILLMSGSTEQGWSIVSRIALPMILGEINIGFIVLLVMSVEGEKEKIAAMQAKLSLDIANKTLPYFRSVNKDSLAQVCRIIKQEIHADAVAMTDTASVLAYVGFGDERYTVGKEIVSALTKKVIHEGTITFSNDASEHHLPQIQSVLIIPLKEREKVTGTLKMYYRKATKMTYSQQSLAIGLSQMISTQLEISRLEQIKEAASKAELQALQSKINPHFLFNALNTIASLIRRDPRKARALIIHLSGYMRSNIERTDELISMEEAIQQVKDYVEIEKARFGPRLEVTYQIEDVDLNIPSLLIQPLVENAIKHGALKAKGAGSVTLRVQKMADRVRVHVRDNGPGIDQNIVERLYQNQMPAKKIGLLNVHQRVKLIYGEGLVVRSLSPGTDVFFDIKKVSQ